MIPITKLVLSGDEENNVLRILRSGQLVQGKEIEEFEEEFASFIGSKYAVAVSSGTTALHLALLALGIGTGDEVITTPFSFIASTNAILYVGAKPVFVDIADDFNIDVNAIEKAITPKTRVILPVHLFGNPCDMDNICNIAKKNKVFVVEDACQAHGSIYRNKKIGSLGDLGCFSFYATKNMTTGEGGMVVTNNINYYRYLKMARSHGSRVRYFHEFLGYNFRMTEMQATIGRVQLKKLIANNEKRIENANYYNEHLAGIKGLVLPKIKMNKKHVFHQYTVRITKDFPINREIFSNILSNKGIGSAIYYPIPIHKQNSMKKIMYNKGSLSMSEQLSKEVISLPVHPFLKKEELEYIVKTIKKL